MIWAMISLQVGHTGKALGSRLGIHFFPQSATTSTPSTLARTMSDFFT